MLLIIFSPFQFAKYFQRSTSLTSFVVDSWEIIMTSQESTTKDVKLVGYDFRGHTRGTLVVGIAYGCPYYKGSAIFSLVFLSTTSEKSFIPWKTSAAVQALKVCSVQPRVLSSWGITLLEKLRAANES